MSLTRLLIIIGFLCVTNLNAAVKEFDYKAYIKTDLLRDYEVFRKKASQQERGVIFFLNDFHVHPELYVTALENRDEKTAAIDHIIFDVLTTGVGFGFSERSATAEERALVAKLLRRPLSAKNNPPHIFQPTLKVLKDLTVPFYIYLNGKVMKIDDQSSSTYTAYAPQIQAHRQALMAILSYKNQKRLYPEKFTSEDQGTLDEFKEFLEKNHGKGSFNIDFLRASLNGGAHIKHILEDQLRQATYRNLIKEILIQELKNINIDKNTLVFYNATSSLIYFLREVWSAAYSSQKKIAHFIPNKLHEGNEVNPDNFLKKYLESRLYFYSLKNKSEEDYANEDKEMKEKGMSGAYWDHIPEVSRRLMAGSILIFDPFGGESAWSVFTSNSTFSNASKDLESKLENIISETLNKIGYKNSIHLARKLTDLYKKYQNLPPQLLQIFVKKEDFDKVGYYCGAGGEPIMTIGSGDVLHSIERYSIPNVFKELTDFEQSMMKAITDATQHIQEWKENGCKSGQCFYKHLEKKEWEQSIKRPNSFLQVRFLSTSSLFSNSNLVNFITYYATDEGHKRAQELRRELKSIFAGD